MSEPHKVTDSELVDRLREIVRHCDMRTTTASAVRRRLEEELAVDLYGRRAFITQQIDIFLRNEDLEEVGGNGGNDLVVEGVGREEGENEDEIGVGQRSSFNKKWMSAKRGPEVPSVLYLQATHISNAVSSETVDNIVRVKRSDNLIWLLYLVSRIHNRVLAYLNYMGFYGVLQCGFHVFDNHLITALVERWRRETHTFHFRCGEATITLQDVSIIWGLKIDGEPVTGVDDSRTVEEWQHICLELLGFEPLKSHFKGGHLSMSALNDHCISRLIDDDSSEVDVVKYSRCVALMIIGGIMFPDYQGGSARLMFLQLLRDINQVKSYSWGSAVLAFLYRELCNATRIGKSIIAGPLYILQIWAWSRIKCVNPDRNGLTLVAPGSHPNEIVPVAPYGARWKNVFSKTHTPTHAVRIIRDCFDRMNNNEFNWIVYNKKDIDVKAIIDSYDNSIWRCVCPLICFEIVEMYRPNRVMRQFKMRQSIPVPAHDNDDLHNITRIGHRNTNWNSYHKDAIFMWNRKFRFVVQSEQNDRSKQTDDDYLQWYERITVRIISPIVHGVGFRPYPYDFCVPGQHHYQQNFSTPSSDSHPSSLGFLAGSSGWVEMVRPSRGFDTAGLSRGGPSRGVDMVGSSGGDAVGPSCVFGTTGLSGGFDGGVDTASLSGSSGRFYPTEVAAGLRHVAHDSFVDQGYQNRPFGSNLQSSTDLLDDDQQHVHDMYTRINIRSLIHFTGYSYEQRR